MRCLRLNVLVCRKPLSSPTTFWLTDLYLLVNHPPKVSVSVLVNSLKGVPSCIIHKKTIAVCQNVSSHFLEGAVFSNDILQNRVRSCLNLALAKKTLIWPP